MLSRNDPVSAVPTTELEEAQLLQSISIEMLKPGDVGALYGKITATAQALMRSQFASMQLFHPDRGKEGELELLANRGFSPRSAEHWRWIGAVSNTSCAEAMRTRHRVVVADAERTAALVGTKDLEFFRENGIRSMQTTPLLTRNGRLVGMLSTHWSEPREPGDMDMRSLDILARQAADLIDSKQAEAALRESEEKYRSVFETMDEGFALCEMVRDPEGRPVDFRFLEVNPAYERFINAGRSELVGRKRSELRFKDARFGVPLFARLVETREPLRIERYFRRPRSLVRCSCLCP
jgi:PAS domain-containing protein